MQAELLVAPPSGEHVAGSRTLRLKPGVTGSATFGGPGNCYRYSLTRSWGAGPAFALVVMMNPSVARTDCDDVTVAKVTRMARSWLGGSLSRLIVTNTFAYRCTDQMRLAEVADPIGPDNDATIEALALAADLVVFAYGKPKLPQLRSRGISLARRLIDLGVEPHALRLSADGTPWHPLLLPDATEPFAWRP